MHGQLYLLNVTFADSPQFYDNDFKGNIFRCWFSSKFLPKKKKKNYCALYSRKFFSVGIVLEATNENFIYWNYFIQFI
jgi:hypothetical protein